MSGRSFADYTYRKKLRTEFGGEVFRANAATGDEVRILHVHSEIADVDGFADALLQHGASLGTFSHMNAVATRQVGRASDDSLVVVTDPAVGVVSVEELLRDAGDSGLPQDMAAAISFSFLQGLAAAHSVGFCHGLVRPSSVVVDVDGVVKVTDFALSHALASAAASNPKHPAFASVFKYFAPEQKRGNARPSRPSDVYSSAAVVFQMLSGGLPPGTLDISPGFERMIQRALDNDVSRRYADANELFENLAEALEDDNWVRASDTELATYVMEAQSRVQGSLDEPGAAEVLDSQTEDLLSLLGGDSKDSGDDEVAPDESALRKVGRRIADSELDPPTEVDAKLTDYNHDPISELIALTGNKAPHDRIDSVSDPFVAAAKPDVDAVPVAQIGQSDESAAMAALAGLDDLDEPEPEPIAPELVAPEPEPEPEPVAPEPEPVAPEPEPVAPEPEPEPEPVTPPAKPARAEQPAPARSTTAAPEVDPVDAAMIDLTGSGKGFVSRLIWAVVALAAIGALAFVVYNQIGMREQADKQSQRQAERDKAALDQYRKDQPEQGKIEVTSEQDSAAVWLLLGRTPLVTTKYSASTLHEIRLELDGHQTKDVRVGKVHWTGEGDDLEAQVRVELAAGEDDKPPPAYPPAPPDSALQGLRKGAGSINLESEPEGAQAWLLVGITPEVDIDVLAGQDYELKVLKDGYLPGYVVIKSKDWLVSRKGNFISRKVELKRKGKHKKRKGR